MMSMTPSGRAGALRGLAAPVSFRLPVLPWAAAAEDERRFRRILCRVLLAALVPALVMPWVPLRKAERIGTQPLPPPLVRLLLERPVTPRLVAVAKAAEARPAPPPGVPPPKAAPVAAAHSPVEVGPPGESQADAQHSAQDRTLDNARRRASGAGLLALKNELAEMTGAPVAVQLQTDTRPGAGVGSVSGPGLGAGSETGVPVRSLIAASAGRGSGGVANAAFSRDTGGGGLAGRATALVEGGAGGGGGGGGGSPGGGGARAGHGSGTGGGAGGTLSRGGSGRASRSIEEIKLVFERNKHAIYALYNRALRDDPALQGKVVVELKIAPAGQVEAVRVVSSDLKAVELQTKLLARIRQFDFGARDVDQMVVTWPVDFLPS